MTLDSSVGLSALTTAIVSFSTSVLFFSFISALLLQAAHESLRSIFNRLVVQRWVRRRYVSLHRPEKKKVAHRDFMLETGAMSEKTLFSLPYWQLTGQINAALSAQLNVNPSADFVQILAYTEPNYRSNLEKRLHEELHKHGREEKEDWAQKREAIVIRDLAARAQNGVNALHATLRAYWNMFDYYFALFFVSLIVITIMIAADQDGFYRPAERSTLYMVGFFSWFATPIVRRVLERLMPFR